MSTSPNPTGAAPIPPDKSTVILLMSTIGDTTWRMFVPSIGFTILGVVADKQFGTKPWLTAVGIIVGVFVAGLLVRLQIKKVQQK
ncbi:MAG: AtpZ/AtpI family protein [Candidatus Saccharimonadales bacterium]